MHILSMRLSTTILLASSTYPKLVHDAYYTRRVEYYGRLAYLLGTRGNRHHRNLLYPAVSGAVTPTYELVLLVWNLE